MLALFKAATQRSSLPHNTPAFGRAAKADLHDGGRGLGGGGGRARTADLDGRLELEEIGLAEEDFSGYSAELADLRLGELHLLPRARRPHLEQAADDIVEEDGVHPAAALPSRPRCRRHPLPPLGHLERSAELGFRLCGGRRREWRRRWEVFYAAEEERERERLGGGPPLAR